MSERQIDVTDEGPLHRYRTEIPNTVVRGVKGRKLSVYAKWLYVYLKSVAGDRGVCHQGMTTLAEGSGLSRAQVGRERENLVGAGLISVEQGSRSHRDPTRITIRDIWLSNMQEFSVSTRDTIEIDEDQKGKEKDKSVSLPETPSVSTRDSSVSTRDSSVSTRDPKKISLRRSLEEELKPPIYSEDRIDIPPVKNCESDGQHDGKMHVRTVPKRARIISRRCPPDYMFDVSIGPWAAERYPDVNVDEAIEAMKDWEYKTARSDWDACLRTWIRNEAKRPARVKTPAEISAERKRKLQQWVAEAQENEDGHHTDTVP